MISKPDCEAVSLGRIASLVSLLSLVLYVLTYNISLQYHQEALPDSPYIGTLFQVIDMGRENYFSTIKNILTDRDWYWLYKLPVALLSPFLSKEPYLLCLVNYIFMALATLCVCRIVLRLKTNFSAAAILTLLLWFCPWNYGVNEVGLFSLWLETSFYWMLTITAANMIVYALEPRSYKNAILAGLSAGLAVWGRGNSMPYVIIVLTLPSLLIIIRVIKSKSAKNLYLKPLLVFAGSFGLLVSWFYFYTFNTIKGYYGRFNILFSHEGGLFWNLFQDPEITLKGFKIILWNVPGIFIFRPSFDFWAVVLTLALHILVILSCVLAVRQWKMKSTRKNRLLAITALTGTTMFYGNLLMALLLMSVMMGKGTHDVIYPFRLMLIGSGLNLIVLAAMFLNKKFLMGFLVRPTVVPAYCVVILIYGYCLSSIFSTVPPKDPNMASVPELERVALNWDRITEEGESSVLWIGKRYAVSSLSNLRLKAGLSKIKLSVPDYQMGSFFENWAGHTKEVFPIKGFRKLLRRVMMKSDYIVIPENIQHYDRMSGHPGLAQRREELAKFLNAPDSPKYAVKMVLHDYGNTRLLLLKRLRRGKDPDNLDLLKLPYGDKNAVYPQHYPRAASDIFKARPPIPFPTENLFDLPFSRYTFWEVTDELPVWVEIQFENKKKLVGYHIASGPSGSNRLPIEWDLQGSNDRKLWETLDSRSVPEGWKAKEKKEFMIQNQGFYYYYRIFVTKGGQISGPVRILRMHGIDLFEKDSGGKLKMLENWEFDSLDKRFVDLR